MNIEELKEYLLKKYDANTILLYGSYSRGDYSNNSDIDIAIFSPHYEIKAKMKFLMGIG